MLHRLKINGFKSIKTMDIELRQLNILIGANGAGKSNLVSFFKMMSEMMSGRFQKYIGSFGRAQSILHFGPKVTPEMDALLEFTPNELLNSYYMRLAHAAGDTLIFAEERLGMERGYLFEEDNVLGSGHQETNIIKEAKVNKRINAVKVYKYLFNRFGVYHFHDTSSNARFMQYHYLGDNRQLLSDAGNIAPFLYRLKTENNTIYQRIVKTINQIAPFFEDFDLEPHGSGKKDIILNWREKGADQVFGPHRLSDGTLRAICLITLLLQPEDELPKMIVVDEPELGLHPFALNIIAELFNRASLYTQVLVSTQSSSFIDNYEPEDIITVDREGKESMFRRLKSAELDAWLEEYSLGEVWEKNVIGGGPH